MLDKKQFLKLEHVEIINGTINFDIPIDFQDLLWAQGMEWVNDQVDQFVKGGYLFADLKYVLKRIEDQTLVVAIFANCEEWQKEA